MKAAIYARKSIGEGDGSRSTIETQKEAMRRFCDAHKIEIVREYEDDGVRGWETDRPGLNAMLADMKRKDCPFHLVVVFEWDRLFRKYAEAEKVIDEIESCGLLTASAEGGIVSNRNEKLGQKAALFVAEIENLVRGEHVLSGQRHWAGLGYVVGARAPYGYKRCIVEDDRKRIRFRYEIDEKEAKIVRKIYALRAQGKTTSEIAQSLNQKDIPSPEGKKWHRGTVHKILYSKSHREKYLGNMVFNLTKNYKKQKKSVPKAESEWSFCAGAHPAILTRQTIEKIERRSGND